VAKARLVVQIDIGFGDSIVPRPDEIEYPVLLEFPVPKLLAYPRETVVAEKLEAIAVLGVLNSRMKDYFDLMLISTARARFKKPRRQIEENSLALIDHEIFRRFRLERCATNFSQHALGTFPGCA
jgi:hypothetical protein